MSLKIEPCDEIKTKPYKECDCQIFNSKAEMNRSLKRLCYGDLYVIGRLWIEGMKSVLVGSKLCLVPVVQAKAKEPPPPQKPPPMKYKDLPLYQSPFTDYYDYEENQAKSGYTNKKILHSALLPHVTHYRKEAQSVLKDAKNSIQDNYKYIYNFVSQKQKEILGYARCNSRLNERRIAVALGATVGFLIGYKTGKGVTKPLVYSGVGALATGALCLPKQTDEAFRSFCWQVQQLGTSLYNFYCSKNVRLTGSRVPCESEIPVPPPPKKEKRAPCPVKK